MGIQDLALTTNGVLLARQARGAVRRGAAAAERASGHAGSRAVPADHAARRSSKKCWKGIETAQRLGFGPIKINAVAVKNLVEPDIVPLVRFGRERGIEVRFIEFMPLDAQGLWSRDNVLSASEMIEMLSREIAPLIEIPDRDPRAPATEYRFADGGGQRGICRLGHAGRSV